MLEQCTNTLLQTYDKILKVDLTNDSYTIIKYDEATEKNMISIAGKISEWLALFAMSGFVYPEDIPLYKKYTALTYVRSYFRRHDNHWIQYRRKNGDVYTWYEMDMLKAEDYTDEQQMIYLYVRQMNDSVESKFTQSHYKQGGKILIVSKSDEEAEKLSDILGSEYALIHASGKEEMHKKLEKDYRCVEAIVIDSEMGENATNKCILSICNYKDYSIIPIIVAIDKNTENYSPAYLKAGASDIIAKPFNKEIVTNRVYNLIDRRYANTMVSALKIDPLTGLYTKDFFVKKAEEILLLEPEKKYRIVCVDIEKFRTINEIYGMAEGDKVLIYLAENLPKLIKNSVVGGRIAADVYAYLREDIPLESDVEQWRALRENAPVPNITIRYGIADYDRSLSVLQVCDRARTAIKTIKGKYDRPVAVYNDEMLQKEKREQSIIGSMEDALHEHQLEVYYQPKLCVKSNTLGGAEALLRWKHPEMGFLSSAEFIPLFEQSGSIIKIDEYVLTSVCEDMARWKQEGLPLVPVSINISRSDFEDRDLVKRIMDITNRFGISPELIQLEVTESIFLDNQDRINEMLSELRANGYIVALDDFGVGYSSVSALSSTPFDVIKIDKSILDNATESGNANILEFCIGLAFILNLTPLVEGVETESQLNMLREFGCEYIQGYFYSRPITKEMFELEFLKDC